MLDSGQTSGEQSGDSENWRTMDYFESDNRTLNSSADRIELTGLQRALLSSSLSVITLLALCINILLILYILSRRLWQNYVSSHFIAHLAATNLLACVYLVPIFLANLIQHENSYALMAGNTTLSQGSSFFAIKISDILCRLHAFTFVAVTTVQHYMIACIAGVHVLTYARIHYEQVFGLKPSVICALSWLIGLALGLPCLTNSAIVHYNPELYHCLWLNCSKIGNHFFVYLGLLGYLLPLGLTYYSYIRILVIFYDCPVVFKALGLFQARYLIFCLLLAPLSILPFFVITLKDGGNDHDLDNHEPHSLDEHPLQAAVIILTYSLCATSAILYSASIFVMKEYDMECERNAQKKSMLILAGQAVGSKRISKTWDKEIDIRSTTVA